MNAAEPTILQSPLLIAAGVPHAFTTRLGGVSRGVFDTLSFGNPGHLPAAEKDPAENIRENQRRVLTKIAAPDRELVEVWQDHGSRVVCVPRGELRTVCEGLSFDTRDTRADALVTDDPQRAVSIRIADCTPVLLASTDGRIVASVHAGWRGVISGVAVNALSEMRRMGAGEIVAAIGPCIGFDAFEVGEEVAQEFERVFGDDAAIVRRSPAKPGKAHVGLKAALARQLASEGISRDQIDVLPGCTVRDSHLYFSHRRDNGLTGRMMAVIGPRA